jgi:hypothetical protein
MADDTTTDTGRRRGEVFNLKVGDLIRTAPFPAKRWILIMAKEREDEGVTHD